jgi:uncharacterized protein YndB with AHSA1/START domain
MVMTDLQLSRIPVATTAMLIRKPVRDVFEAVADPRITTQFWFSKGSGRLEEGTQVHWEWEMYGIVIPVDVKAVEPNKRIVFEWPGQNGPTTVEWTFDAQPNDTTFVSVKNEGFTGTGDELVKEVAGSVQGFSLVLAGMKAFLEYGIRLNLVADRYPQGLEEH